MGRTKCDFALLQGRGSAGAGPGKQRPYRVCPLGLLTWVHVSSFVLLISWMGTSGCSYSSGAQVTQAVPWMLQCPISVSVQHKGLPAALQVPDSFQKLVEKNRKEQDIFLQFKFVLQTPVNLAELWGDAWSFLEVGSVKLDREELAGEGALVLLIICISGEMLFLSTLKTICSAWTVVQSSVLINSCSGVMWMNQITSQHCLHCLSNT